MRKGIVFSVLLAMGIMCSRSNDIASTATDVNTGSITGSLLIDGKKFRDSLTVSLYSGNAVLAKQQMPVANPLAKTLETIDGDFCFDSLAAGVYSIRVFKDSLVVGEQTGIVLSNGEQKAVNVIVVVIINQIFNIINIFDNQNVTINSFYFTGASGFLGSTAGGEIVAAFTEADTVYITMQVSTSGRVDTLTVGFVKQPDGTYSNLPLETALPVEITGGSTVINTGSGSDSSRVGINGRIHEETR